MAINAMRSASVRDDKIRSACSHAEKSRLRLLPMRVKGLVINSCVSGIRSRGETGVTVFELTTDFLRSLPRFVSFLVTRPVGLRDLYRFPSVFRFSDERATFSRLNPLAKT